VFVACGSLPSLGHLPLTDREQQVASLIPRPACVCPPVARALAPARAGPVMLLQPRRVIRVRCGDRLSTRGLAGEKSRLRPLSAFDPHPSNNAGSDCGLDVRTRFAMMFVQ
jgi:hypothetical protein